MMKKLLIIVAVTSLGLLFIKRKDMTLKQSILKVAYPIIAKTSRVFGDKGGIERNAANVKPITSFYNLKGVSVNGEVIDFSALKGTQVLIVNTASDCGYTGQYAELQKLNEQYNGRLVIFGFPANDFKDQEKGEDNAIASFCKVNYGVTFQLMKKSKVVKGDSQNEVYRWLSDKHMNGWNNKAPEWNFSKYFINRDGILTHYFGPAVSPLSKEVVENL
ncbi:MAG: glutathione peroxidase [Segetibacter sp.]|nr:glutathione peroxidase [Segetibacter sp.]